MIPAITPAITVVSKSAKLKDALLKPSAAANTNTVTRVYSTPVIPPFTAPAARVRNPMHTPTSTEMAFMT